MILYHYTCEHGREGIGDIGTVVSIREHAPEAFQELVRRGMGVWGLLSWFTNLAEPHREVLGLTSETIECDRTQYRYRVTDQTNVEWWVSSSLREQYPRDFLNKLELYGYAMPAHWYVAVDPVPVVFDPIRQGVSA